MAPTRVLITGATGLLGRAIYHWFSAACPNAKQRWLVKGTGFTRAKKPLIKLDLNDTKQVMALCMQWKPQVIIHCAAERRPNVCKNSPDAATALNVSCSSTIATIATKTGAWVLYISTNYVFNGKNPPYTPSSATDPLNLYGRTKLAGEYAVRKAQPKCGVLRIPLLFGGEMHIQESGITKLSVNVLSRTGNTGKSKPTTQQSKQSVMTDQKSSATPISTAIMLVNNDQLKFPTLTSDIAFVCEQIVYRHIQHPNTFCGTWHWGSNEGFTKYQITNMIAKQLGISAKHIRPRKGYPVTDAPRPMNCQMDCSALEKLGIGRRTKFATALKAVQFLRLYNSSLHLTSSSSKSSKKK